MAKSVRDIIIDTLKPLGLNAELQGDYESEYHLPESFVTYFIPDSTILKSYNNKPTLIGYSININYYSSRMEDIKTMPDKILDAMIAAGFAADGVGYDTGLDKVTGRRGWLMDFYYVEERSY
ncbi:MAG: hypothetical protein ACI4S2_12365 [Lachnospiraceae bacterium]